MAHKIINKFNSALGSITYQFAKICGHQNYLKFIVLTRSRVGSNLLRYMLNSHHCIHAYGEIFSTLNGKNVHNVYSKIFCRHPKYIKAVGFKIFYYHPLDDDSNDIWTKLMETEKLHVIHLKRRNILRTLVSRKIAGQQGKWILTDKKSIGNIKEKKVHFKSDELKKGFEQTREWEKHFHHMFEPKSLIEVYYEDLVCQPEEEFKKILDVLSLPFSSPKIITKKQNPEKSSQLITNYKELKEAFSNTEWSGFFED